MTAYCSLMNAIFFIKSRHFTYLQDSAYEYVPFLGMSGFSSTAAALLLGPACPAMAEGRVLGVQVIIRTLLDIKLSLTLRVLVELELSRLLLSSFATCLVFVLSTSLDLPGPITGISSQDLGGMTVESTDTGMRKQRVLTGREWLRILPLLHTSL